VTFLGREWPSQVGQAARQRREQLGFVFQEPFLIPYLTVRENAVIQVETRDDASRLDPLAAELGLTAVLDELPARLSAGEQQRASLMRALIRQPALILADEPTAWLDRENALQVVRLLTSRLDRSSVIVVTHDASIVEQATRTFRIEEGRLAEAGRPAPGSGP
jgi:putative ABC transport system ATP-binding protein